MNGRRAHREVSGCLWFVVITLRVLWGRRENGVSLDLGGDVAEWWLSVSG